MGIEAFVWSYEGGEPASFRFTDVLSAFGEAVERWEPQYGCLHLNFNGPPDSCHVFCGKDAAETGWVRGLTISRPVRHSALWNSVLHLMSDHHAVLFFSDDTTPRFWNLQSVQQYPEELIDSLGAPICVRSPDDILASLKR